MLSPSFTATSTIASKYNPPLFCFNTSVAPSFTLFVTSYLFTVTLLLFVPMNSTISLYIKQPSPSNVTGGFFAEKFIFSRNNLQWAFKTSSVCSLSFFEDPYTLRLSFRVLHNQQFFVYVIHHSNHDGIQHRNIIFAHVLTNVIFFNHLCFTC